MLGDRIIPGATSERRDWPRWLAAAGGFLLMAIGIRFLLDPETAARGFGLPRNYVGYGFHDAIAMRDLWLGALAVLLALFKEWRSLALWFALGTVVCLGDAAVVATAGGKWAPIVFHLCAGVVCLGLALAFWRRSLPVSASPPASAPLPSRTLGLDGVGRLASIDD